MNVYKHTAAVAGAVHDELVRWAKRLLVEAGLEVVDVWGRFPTEGTTRSHLVLFPYRVGPDIKMVDNVPGMSLIVPTGYVGERTQAVPSAWAELGSLILDNLPNTYPEIQAYDGTGPARTSPFPLVDDLEAPLKEWYRQRPVIEDGSGWTVSIGGKLHAKPPSLYWRKGITIGAFYLVVAGDPGRGTSQRTSDTAPLSLSALSVLSVAIQRERTLGVKLPPIDIPIEMETYVEAFCKVLDMHKHETATAHATRIRELMGQVTNIGGRTFLVSPVHDLNNQEFALLTQALQRPLQAIMNLRLQIPVGDLPDFQPGTAIYVNTMQERGNKRKERTAG